MKTFQDFLHIMDFNGNQAVQGPIYGLFFNHPFLLCDYLVQSLHSIIHTQQNTQKICSWTFSTNTAPISDNRQKQLYI